MGLGGAKSLFELLVNLDQATGSSPVANCVTLGKGCGFSECVSSPINIRIVTSTSQDP